jgi:hypothetical protein
MSQPLSDIEAQLNRLLNQPNAAMPDPDAPADKPADTAAPKQSEEQLANEIDQLLKEANEQAAGAAQEPSPPSSTPIESTTMPTMSAGDSTIQQIDALLAGNAAAQVDAEEELLGNMQTVEEATAMAAAPPPEVVAPPQPVAPPPEPEPVAAAAAAAETATPIEPAAQAAAPASVEESLDEMLEGDIQTLDEATGATKPELSPAAAAVAAELDADEAQHKSPAPPPAPAPAAAAVPAPATPAAQAKAEPAANAPAAAPAPAEVKEPGINPVVMLLVMLNRPLANVSPLMRDAVGFIGVYTFMVSAGLLAFAYGGKTAALITVGAMSPVFLAAFYLLFIKRRDGGSAAV